MKKCDVYDFLSKIEYKHIFECVKNNQPFEHSKEINGIKFNLHNSTAGYDWECGVKQGDYTISMGYGVSTAGGGYPITVSEFLKDYGTYESAIKKIDKYLNHLTEYGYVALSDTVKQLTLF